MGISLSFQENTTNAAVFMIVEDDEEIRSSVADALAELGRKTLRATNGDDAIRLLESINSADLIPHMIFLDVMMPTMGGEDFLKWKRSHPLFKDVPVAVMTAGKTRLDDPSVVAHITKPFDLNEFLKIASRSHLPSSLHLQ